MITHYQLNDAKMFADVTDGTAIVINSLTGIYYGMNGFGTSIYENLQSGASVPDILAAAKAIPGAPEELESAFGQFVDSLVGYEIVIPAEEASSVAPMIDPEIARADGFIPLCTEYQDVQDLLFADPIHEVDVDTGWQPE